MARQSETKGIAALEMTCSVLAALCFLYGLVVTFTAPTQAQADSSEEPCGKTAGYLNARISSLSYSLANPAASNGECARYPFQRLRADQLAPIADIVEKAMRDGKTPGAVVLIGNHGEVVYRRAFGFRSLEPEQVPMTEDTIFDMASVTKVVATTTAIMQLAEKRKLDIEAPVARYWPAFRKNGKAHITVRQLLTHYSGLRPDLSFRPRWSGYKDAMKKIIAERPELSPGAGFIYSDINFEVLGELVRRVSGRPLDEYCAEKIFKPLGMKDTVFRPSGSLHDRIAPTRNCIEGPPCGWAHDPSCYKMGGVAGHAGLFSTADDLSIFAQTLLNGGKHGNTQILTPETVDTMTATQTPAGKKNLRGFGWDVEAPFASNREELFPAGAYGHLGYTGTALWIDPVSDTYIIVLTNRVYPDGKGDIKELRAQIKKTVADALGPVSDEQVLHRRPSLVSCYERIKRHRAQGLREKVLTGIDVLSAEHFLPLKGLRVGLITNHTGRDSSGRSTIDLLRNAPGVKLTAVFSPEHGLSGKDDSWVASAVEPASGLPVFSLYGKVRKPTEEMLKGLDALVFDIQDAGVRFYTYISTMGYAMEAAAKKGIAFYVLDRPDPINASLVQGPVMDKELKSFTGYFPLPVRHGMTVGELAGMFNAENRIGVKLHVIKMSGYTRTEWFDETGLLWISLSPNLRSLTEAILYPGVAMVEGANVSVGRGTDTPFELLGAPWINAEELAAALNSRNIRGVHFTPTDFVPKSDIYMDKVCHGVRITLPDRTALDAGAMGIEVAGALYTRYPRDFQIDKTLGLIGSRGVLQAIRDGRTSETIAPQWRNTLEEFMSLRAKYLLY
ncbi:MAG: exo-beta-N-acetylmuramidase NamZ domain-containing protein [Thermodesulfovibrionales bacterium]